MFKSRSRLFMVLPNFQGEEEEKSLNGCLEVCSGQQSS